MIKGELLIVIVENRCDELARLGVGSCVQGRDERDDGLEIRSRGKDGYGNGGLAFVERDRSQSAFLDVSVVIGDGA